MSAYGWAMCARCGDVHRESERTPIKYNNSFFIMCCPVCNARTMAPLAKVPMQRSIFEVRP